MTDKAKIQEDQYDFPYHFIPAIENEAIVCTRSLQWSMIYMTYITYVCDVLERSEVQRILDVGCGDGRMSYELHQRGTTHTIHGIDISERALQFARAFTPHGSFEVFDIIKQPYPKTFDAITYIETIEHIPPEAIPTMIKHMAESLRPGGHLFLTTPTTNVPTHKKHYQHFDRKLIESYFDNYFTVVDVCYLNVENWLSRLLGRLLINRLCTINATWYRRLIYRLYRTFNAFGTEKTGSRIFIHAVTRSEETTN